MENKTKAKGISLEALIPTTSYSKEAYYSCRKHVLDYKHFH